MRGVAVVVSVCSDCFSPGSAVGAVEVDVDGCEGLDEVLGTEIVPVYFFGVDLI